MPTPSKKIKEALASLVAVEKLFEEHINLEVSQQWEAILKKGCDGEEKQMLLKNFKIPENCPSIVPPKIKPKVKIAMTEVALKRDQRMEEVQSQMRAALATVGNGMSELARLEEEEEGVLMLNILATVNNKSKLLADVHHQHSKNRQNIVSTSLDKHWKDIIENSQLDEWLFGNNLQQKLRATKENERSGIELRKKFLTIDNRKTNI